ncbi:DNA-binding response regulator [Paenibacillus sp. CCS19]|uniref:response regulator transcription factor n=1 Tax=Paenibacillus sp. CCS19 TaxID=3158387 RepID=UPI002560D956|nr:response regulator transcription factor [Paenibacillus cellulosilyticus]GMK36984.1 DNA-binding response regulator [Paenibacillus cellulosilyticus]
MFRIMIVEDDEKIRAIVTDALRKWQFEVVETTSFHDLMNVYKAQQPHLILLDVNLPVYDGFYWCQQIRTVSKVPIIFLSSRSQNMDVIMAINMGGDDYIQKPFDLGILVAKVNALLRRNYTYQDDNMQLTRHQLVLHLSNSTVRYQDQTAELSRNESLIMQTMMRNAGRIVTRDELMQVLWNDDQFVDDNTLTVNVNRLRRKIASLGLEEFISTRKGLGYIVE